MYKFNGCGIGSGKIDFLDEVRELYYVVESRAGGEEASLEYYISLINHENKKGLKVRVIKSAQSQENADAWINIYETHDGEFSVDDELVRLIVGIYPAGNDALPDAQGGVRIDGLPGRYSMEHRHEENILGAEQVAFNLERNHFIPENFYSEMIFDLRTGLLTELSRVDTSGFLSIELKNILKE